MSSVLDALSPVELAQVEAAVHMRGLERMLVEDALYEMLRQSLVREIVLGTSAAGAEWSTSVPGGSTWEVLSAAGRLVASAAVASRFPSVVVTDTNNAAVKRAPGGTTVAAGQTSTLFYMAGYGDHVNSGVVVAALPDPPMLAFAGWTVASLTSNLDVGDQYTQVVLIVREWSPLAIVRACRQLLGDLDSAGGIRYGAVR